MLTYALLAGAVLAVVALLAWGEARRRRARFLAAARGEWGQAQPLRRRDAEAIAGLRRAKVEVRGALQPGAREPDDADGLRLSDASWADLDLDGVFAQLDRTLTEPGQQVLHELLRTPLADLARLERRSQALAALEGAPGLREELADRLERLAQAPPGVLAPALGHAQVLPALPLPRLAYQALALGAVASAALFGLSREAGFAAAGVAFVLNLVAHYNAQRALAAALPAISALQALFAAARRLAAKPLPGLEPEQEQVRARLAAQAPLARALASVTPATGLDDSFLQYVDIFLLRQERLFARAAPYLAQGRGEVLDLVDAVGMLDALRSLASWRAGLGGAFCTPRLEPGAALEADDVRHPLVEGCVANPLRLAGGALVTGSNMSGKSTWLRAVALNALLAQVAHTCLARSWRGPPVRLLTCIRRADSVLAGRSYYLAEAQGILEIVRAAAGTPRLFCVLDEIFRGTNSIERVAAAGEVLRYLGEQGALVLAATHDHPLTETLAGLYDNVHFSETVGEGGLAFDYLLKPGPATTSNAILLLEHLGYPAEIIARARATR